MADRADAVRDTAEAVGGWAEQHALGLTSAVMLLLGAFGAFLFARGHADSKKASLGLACLTGALFALAAIAVQVTVERSSFRTAVAVSSDLSGFDPHGKSLEGFHLAAKKLIGASLGGTDLRGANLAYSDLADANLKAARLEGADLSYASAARADLTGADLSDAHLEGAKFFGTYLSDAVLEGAQVHRWTCFTVEGDLGIGVDTLIDKGLVSTDKAYAVLGHECTLAEQHPFTDTEASLTFICEDGRLVPDPRDCGPHREK